MTPLDPVAPTPLGAVDAEAGRLDAIRRMPKDGARGAAAKELEVMFLTELMQAMRKTIPENDYLPASPARQVYEGAFDRNVAEAMAERDPFGLVAAMGQSETGPAAGLKVAPQAADTIAGHQDETGRGGTRP